MVERPLSNRIQKTTIFFVIALATLGAVGVMTTMITSATTADAARGGPSCQFTPNGGFVCPPPLGGRVCQPDLSNCRDIGPD